MSPALITTYLALANGILAAAPDLIAAVATIKQIGEALFTSKVITKEQQNAVSLFAEANMALLNAGITPDWLKVDPDPE